MFVNVNQRAEYNFLPKNLREKYIYRARMRHPNQGKKRKKGLSMHSDKFIDTFFSPPPMIESHSSSVFSPTSSYSNAAVLTLSTQRDVVN